MTPRGPGEGTVSAEHRSATRRYRDLTLVTRATLAAALVSLLMLVVQGGLYLKLQRTHRWAGATETAVAVARAVALGNPALGDVAAMSPGPGIEVAIVDQLPSEELRAGGDTFVDRDDDAALAWAPLGDDGALWVRASVRLAVEPTSPLLLAHVALSLCILLVVLLLSRRFGKRYIAARIEEIARFTDALAAGSNARRSRLATVDDELGRLAARLNRLADRLDMARKQVELERRTRDQAQQELRVADRLASVGKVASTIAHDLGTPLNVITGQAELLQMRTDEQSPASRTASRIHEQALRMRDIIENVLRFARERTSGFGASSASIRPVITDMVELLDYEASDAGVRLQIDACADVSAYFEPSSLLQALTNIGQNAIQASGPGDVVRVTCATRVVERDDVGIPAGVHPGDHVLVVAIADAGAGMTPEQQAQVFRPFYATKGDGRGTGLGLAITTEIIASFDGALTVESTAGEGTTFRVWLRVPTEPAGIIAP